MFDVQAYHNFTELSAALAFLAGNPEAIVIAGGTDVLIRMREGKLPGAVLCGIRDIEALRGVSLDGERISIGALCTFDELERDPVIRGRIPILSGAAAQAGGPQLRHMGTVGGNVCNGATSADTASSLLALNARLRLVSAAGERSVPLSAFYAGPGKVHLRGGEILTRIEIDKEDYSGYGGHYIKYAMRRAMDIATLGCAALVKRSGNAIEDVRLAYGVAAPTPVRCPGAEALAAGKPLTEETLRAVAAAALAEINPRTSWRASRAFRLQLAEELAYRALCEASGLAG